MWEMIGMNYEKIEELCVSSIYWEMSMRDALKELLEKNPYVSNGVRRYFGEIAWNILTRKEEVVFSDWYVRGKGILDTLLRFESGESLEQKALFEVFEDVCFYVGEVVRTYERVRDIVSLCLDDSEVEAIVDMIGASVGGYIADLDK